MGKRRVLSWTLGSAILILLSPALFCQADEDCQACHEDDQLVSEAGKPMFVDGGKLRESIHGQAGLSCVDCHADLKKAEDYPHASPLRAVDCGQCHEAAAREFQESVHEAANKSGRSPVPVGCKDCHGTHDVRGQDDFDSMTFPLNLPATCEKCHLENIPSKKGAGFIGGYNDSAHFKGLERSGLTMSANCSNCHDSHKIKKADDPQSFVSRKNIIRTCGSCHVGIQKEYLEGVHGKDYIKGIKDVPVCTDCHNEHAILPPEDINSKVYATKVAEVCVRCHDDVALSRQYGFLTSRLKTYSETFHGTAAKFGEAKVANCASCHGFHGIRPSADPESSIHPDNLPQTCGKCHPGASRRFAEGQIHAIPEEAATAKYRTSHIVKNIYIIVIAVIIGVMLIFIGADFLRRLFGKERHG